MSTIKVNNIQSRTGSAISFTSGDTITIPSGATITNNGTATGFSSTGIDDNATSTAITINSSEQVIIGGTTPENSSVRLEAQDATNPILQVKDTTSNIICGIQAGNSEAVIRCPQDSPLAFNVGASEQERMRIESDGDILINKTSNSFTTAGVILNRLGNCFFTAAGNSGVNVNRLSDDGALVRFYQDNSEEGSISVSGSTVSYNGFTGTHWSRLADNSKPTILKGTILESLDEMMDWYQVQFDITETDDEGNETTRTEKQSYALSDGESVGDVITYTYEGTDYQATIIQEGDIKHTKSKISDTVDAKNVYGVFMAWDNDDDTVNDMYVAQTGTFVVRINGSETVSKGDLIQSNGDGTGKVQADDIIRSSTVAKVLSTTKIETYSDGSYIVPCSLHC